MCIRDRVTEGNGCQVGDNSTCPELFYCNEGTCVRKSLYPPTTLEIIGSIAVLCISGIANAGGLGGGAILTPILIILFKFKIVESIMIAYVLVFAGSFCNFLIVFHDHDPISKQPIIDYDMALIMLPLLIMGTVIGVKVNYLIPEAASLFIVLCLLLYLFLKAFKKANELYKSESEANEDSIEEPLRTEETINQHLTTENPMKAREQELIDQLHLLHAEHGPEGGKPVRNRASSIVQIIKEEHKSFSFYRNRTLFGLLLLLIVLNILKGSEKIASPIGVPYCGQAYWAIELIIVASCFICSKWTMFIIFRKYKKKEIYNIPLGDAQITQEFVGAFSRIAFFAGLIAGMCGIGGGMIISPMLLENGYGAKKATATSGYTVVFTSFMSMFIVMISGGLTIEQFLWFLGLALIGSFIVGKSLRFLVMKFNRQSITLIALTIIILLSLFIIPTYGITRALDNPAELLEFGQIC
eukprot:TRINITY_DN3893_c0_g3_i1.p1 TRINITY_DN3893_c0_g3~~TRINITY_DN3893_c0_g3_i1.p1  ORF type:complete len:485 (+),score=88.69 TRINITY_DN3893_c0_g3_i1:50-1456(+)